MIFGGGPLISRWTSVSFPNNKNSQAHCSRERTDTFEINRERAIDYLNTRDNVYVFDGYAGVSRNVTIPSISISFSSHFSGIPSTASKFVSSVHEPIMRCSWSVHLQNHDLDISLI